MYGLLYYIIYLFCIIKIYPRTTSRIIITENPIAKNTVPVFECEPCDISGISSSTTTYIIAPAANDKKNGITGTIIFASIIVIIAPKGSTAPESTPPRNACDLLIPSDLSGIEIMAPSGKFCIAIPTASANAPATEIPVFPSIQPAYTAPTDIPSGMLCMVTASKSIVVFLKLLWSPSDSLLNRCKCGTSLSIPYINKIPIQKPTITGIIAFEPLSRFISIAGMIRLQTEAATITPAANPVSALCNLSSILLFSRNTQAEPSEVPKNGISIPNAISVFTVITPLNNPG